MALEIYVLQGMDADGHTILDGDGGEEQLAPAAVWHPDPDNPDLVVVATQDLADALAESNDDSALDPQLVESTGAAESG